MIDIVWSGYYAGANRVGLIEKEHARKNVWDYSRCVEGMYLTVYVAGDYQGYGKLQPTPSTIVQRPRAVVVVYAESAHLLEILDC